MELEKIFRAKRPFIIVIDNPHLCLEHRIALLTDRITSKVPDAKITLAGNYPRDIKLANGNIRLIPFHPHREIKDEQEFLSSFSNFSKLPLLHNIKLPVSKLDFFDAAGYDSLLFAYRASCEIDTSLPGDMHEDFDMVIIIGSSHFNYPFPEKILAELKDRNLINRETPILGVPVGPISGPLSPHWCSACSRVLLNDEKSLGVLQRINPSINGAIVPKLFENVPVSPGGRAPVAEGKTRILIDWTFIHNWQLKSLLRELANSDIKDHVQIYITVVSDETSQMLSSKWHHLIEELSPEFITIGTQDFYQAIAQMEIVIGFVFGRDIWTYRRQNDGVVVCDFAGWWRAFGFEGPTPIASAKQVLETIAKKMTKD